MAASRDVETGYRPLQEQQSPHFFVKQPTGREGLEAQAKSGFLRKVYSLLSVQLLVTFVISLACMTPNARATIVPFIQLHSTAFNILTFVPLVLVLIGLNFMKDKYPMNYVMLGVFTVLMSLDIGVVCAVVADAGHAKDCALALLLTVTIFCSLTAFTFWSKTDFNYLHGWLFSSLMALIVLGLVQIFFPFSNTVALLVDAFGVLVFSGYIVYDTSKLDSGVWGPDDYITATIEIYLDIVNLFLYILDILLRSDR
jgi:FtsH-binding integral membrane protein